MIDTTTDAFLGGRVMLVQPRRGHRAGLDAALLQAVVPADASGTLVDLGSGVGTVAFCVAARVPGVTTVAIERESDLIAYGRAALALPGNVGIAGRARFAAIDIAAGATARAAAGLADGSFDWVLMNPPFDLAAHRSAAAEPLRERAHVAAADTIETWMRAAAALARPGGAVAVIHRAQALPDLLAAMRARFGGVTVLPFHPRDGAAATRILVSARRGSHAPMRILPGLILHTSSGGWSADIGRVLAGKCDLTPFFADVAPTVGRARRPAGALVTATRTRHLAAS